MNKIIKIAICQGVPASGKTTWAKEFINFHQQKDNYSWVRINRDDLRNSTGVNYHFKNEDFITKLEHQAIINAMESGLNIISDNTNLNPKHLTELKQVILDTANRLGIEVDIDVCEFKIPFEEAVKRDAQRENPVGKKVIRSFYHKYYPGFDKKVDERNYVPYDPNLPDCIISDIDGTISLMNGRSPYKGEDCVNDLPNKPVIDVIRAYACLKRSVPTHSHNVDIILFSGRNGESEEQTRKWLADNNVPYDKLVMREIGNMEKDSTLKERFYYEHINGRYNVLFWLDDRQQVVDMVRKTLNVPCLQVWYGDF